MDSFAWSVNKIEDCLLSVISPSMAKDQLPQCPKSSRVPRFLASSQMFPRGGGQHIRFGRDFTVAGNEVVQMSCFATTRMNILFHPLLTLPHNTTQQMCMLILHDTERCVQMFASHITCASLIISLHACIYIQFGTPQQETLQLKWWGHRKGINPLESKRWVFHGWYSSH